MIQYINDMLDFSNDKKGECTICFEEKKLKSFCKNHKFCDKFCKDCSNFSTCLSNLSILSSLTACTVDNSKVLANVHPPSAISNPTKSVISFSIIIFYQKI